MFATKVHAEGCTATLKKKGRVKKRGRSKEKKAKTVCSQGHHSFHLLMPGRSQEKEGRDVPHSGPAPPHGRQPQRLQGRRMTSTSCFQLSNYIKLCKPLYLLLIASAHQCTISTCPHSPRAHCKVNSNSQHIYVTFHRAWGGLSHRCHHLQPPHTMRPCAAIVHCC